MVLELASSPESRWKSLPADQVCTKITKGTTPPKSEIVADQDIPFVRVNNLTVGGGNGLAGGVIYVTGEAHRGILARSIAKPGDILMNIVGPPLGKLTMLGDEFAEYNLNQAVLIFRPDTRIVSKEFLFAYLCSEVAQTWLEGRSKKTSGQQNLTIEVCKELSIPLPPLREQQKIAEILSTWDKAIQTTEALLANARTQKRALMQALLTGTRRFPSFEGQPWREVRLKQIADIIVSNVDKKSETDELPIRLCNYTDVYKNDTIRNGMDFMEATATTAQIKRFRLKVGDVIITKDSEDPTDIAISAYVAEAADDLVCGYHLAIIRANDQADGRFLKYCFELPHTRYYFGARANGATRFGLNIGSIETAVFRVPSVEEQRAVADAIWLVEQEISHTIRELDHLRTEKKPLMQQLLTGKRRVVA